MDEITVPLRANGLEMLGEWLHRNYGDGFERMGCQREIAQQMPPRAGPTTCWR